MDPKVRVGNNILIFARVWAIIMTILVIISGVVLIIVGFVTKTSAAEHYGGAQETPNYILVWPGIGCFGSILFIWIGKWFIEGYGLIVINSARQLVDSFTTTYIDEVHEKKMQPKGRYPY